MSERPLCAKQLHFLDAEGATYKRSDGRTGCVACKRSRAKRSRQRVKQKKAQREAAEQARGKKVAEAITLNPASVPPAGFRGGLVSGEAAARYRLALRVRASRRT